MFDLQIESLHLHIENAVGHEHRLQPIALRAVALLADRLAERVELGAQLRGNTKLAELSARPMELHLNDLDNEQAAEGVARAWATALTSAPGDDR